MTTGKDVDGFGESYHGQASSGVSAYGAAPFDLPDWPSPFQPFHPPSPILPVPPVVIPPVVPLPSGDGFLLSVSGPLGVVMTIQLSPAEWNLVRAKIVDALGPKTEPEKKPAGKKGRK